MKDHTTGVRLAAVTAALQRIAPLERAEEWDNVGCLLAPAKAGVIRRILLTIDTSSAVVDEAVRKRIDLIVSYHPPLFQSVKRLDPADATQLRLLKLIEARIAVYSPHTALDAVEGGVNDWLVAGIRQQDDASAAVIQEGPGRILEFRRGVLPDDLIARLRDWLSAPYARVARPVGRTRRIKRVAVCAGAGFSALASTPADAYVTGEMRHHDVLAAVSEGAWVVLFEHTHTERGYLPTLRRALEEAVGSAGVEILISERDRDPIELV